MKKLFAFALVFFCRQALAQNKEDNKPARLFETERLVNANTTEIVPRGKMIFKVTHNFDDIAGSRGGIRKFFGLDNSTDVRIGFHVGLTDRLNISLARAKGGAIYLKTRVTNLYELGLKYQLLRQMENDPSHPLSLALFANNVTSTANSKYPVNPNDTALNQPSAFPDFGDRMSQVLQAIVAKKAGRVSMLLNFTWVHQGYVPLHDQRSVFAVGAGVRLPLGHRMNLIVDYFHSFRSESSKNYFKKVDNSYNPALGDIDKNPTAIKFSDPLSVGLEIITSGHVFHLNFTNATEILDNRLIPYTTSSWGKGEFRWAFNLARLFTLWKVKK